MSNPRVLKTGHTVVPIDEKDRKRISNDFPTYEGLVRLQPGNWFLNETVAYFLDELHDFDFKSNDVLVITYPKSGTTWMQEIVWTLLHNPDLDNPDAKISIDGRAPHIEADGILRSANMPRVTEEDLDFVKLLKEVAPHLVKQGCIMRGLLENVVKSPRVMKSHLPIPLFPSKMLETSKVVYLARDARDVIISKYHFWKDFLYFNYKGDIDSFVDYFINEEQANHPYWTHVKAAYDLKDHPNVLFLHFEDLKADPKKTITTISEFLNLNRTPEQIQNVVNYTDFKSMKQRSDEGVVVPPMGGGDDKNYKTKGAFFRKGTSGNWKEAFTQEQVDKITKWMDKNMAMFPSEFKYKE